METDKVVKTPENTEDLLDMYEVFKKDGDVDRYANALQREDFDAVDQISSLKKVENQLKYAPQEELYSLISNFLDFPDIEIKRVAIKYVSKVNEYQRSLLQKKVDEIIEQAINSSDVQISRIGMNLIDYVSDDIRVRVLDAVYFQIVIGLKSADILKQKVLAKKIEILPEEKRPELFIVLHNKMLNWLKTEDVLTVRFVAQMLRYLPIEMQVDIKELVRKFYELNKNNPDLVKSGIYYGLDSQAANTQKRFNFSKTGSRIVLLFAEKLRYQALVRIIDDSCFLEWKRAYESAGLWKSLGFDYVPIEPILSYNKRKNGTTSCVTGMLDLNYDEWLSVSDGQFMTEIESQKDKIDKGLRLLGIKHGHLNNDNYCLRFYRDEEGNIDFSKTPKIIVIDFDRAQRVDSV